MIFCKTSRVQSFYSAQLARFAQVAVKLDDIVEFVVEFLMQQFPYNSSHDNLTPWAKMFVWHVQGAML